MDRNEIKKISQKKISQKDFQELKNILSHEYIISHGEYKNFELKKAIDNKKPFFIRNNFVIGYKNYETFLTDNNKEIKIERMVKAIIIEDIKDETTNLQQSGDIFAIIGKNQWDSDIIDFMNIIGDLKVGTVFLPPHSAVFNFLQPTEDLIKKKIVSMLEGININIYSFDNYVDNAIHEIGHLFWRDCVKFEEKLKFKEHFKYLKPSALYQYDWEKSDEEEVFCTIYKWFVKSQLMNPSFLNILEHEDKEGFNLLIDILDRKMKDKIINDMWQLNKDNLFEYLNPPFDITTGKKIVKKGLFESIKDIDLPDEALKDVNTFYDGTVFINLNKAVIPVKGNKIDWKNMEKAKQWKKK